MKNNINTNSIYATGSTNENEFKGFDALFLSIVTILSIVFSVFCIRNYMTNNSSGIAITNDNYQNYISIEGKANPNTSIYNGYNLVLKITPKNVNYKFNIDELAFSYTFMLFSYDPTTKTTTLLNPYYGIYDSTFNSDEPISINVNSLAISSSSYRQLEFQLTIKNVSGSLTKWRVR